MSSENSDKPAQKAQWGILIFFCIYIGLAFHAFVVFWLFSKSTFSKNLFRNTVRVLNGLNQDQNRRSIGRDLGLNCKVYQQASKVATSKKRVNDPMKLWPTAIVFYGHVRCVNFILNDSVVSRSSIVLMNSIYPNI